MLACNCPIKRRFWMLTRSGHWFEMLETVFTDKECIPLLHFLSKSDCKIFLVNYVELLRLLQQMVLTKVTKVCQEKNWFGTVNCLHYAFRLRQAKFLGTRANFTHAQTTFSEGPSRVKFWLCRDNIWYDKIIYTTKFTRVKPLFLVRMPFLSKPAKIFL